MKRLILSTIVIAAPVFAADPADVLEASDRACAAADPGNSFPMAAGPQP